MKRAHPLGIRRQSVPIPPDPKATRYVEEGRLRVGVEYRVVDDAALEEQFTATGQEQLLEETRAEWGFAHGDISYEGVSIHVFDASTGLEHLRFDAFPEDPHYHYIAPGAHHDVIVFDDVAEPNFTDWVLNRLEMRMLPMLRHAGAEELVEAISDDEVARIIPRVRQLVSESRGVPIGQGGGPQE